jgi:hypothetical protein
MVMPEQEQPRILNGLPNEESFVRRIQNSIVAVPTEFGENRSGVAPMLTPAPPEGSERTRFDANAPEAAMRVVAKTPTIIFAFMSIAPRKPLRERETVAPRIDGKL